MGKLYLLVTCLIYTCLLSAQTPTNYWQGTVDTVWQNASNWSTGIVPTSNDSVIVPEVQNDLTISSPVSCKYLIILNGGMVKTLQGANLLIGLDLSVGEGQGGILMIQDGSVDINRNFQTRANSSFDIMSGSISFQEWVEDYETELYYAKGNIRLSGGFISGTSVYFSNIDLIGTMDGPFQMELTGNLYTSENWDISGGHILLTHTFWMGGIGFSVSPNGSGVGKICSVTMDFPNSADYHTSIPFASEKLQIIGNLDIVSGTVKTHKNFWYNIILDTLAIQGDLRINEGAKFDFDSTNTVLNLSGDFINNGSLNPSQGEVLFSGTNQIITGNTRFNVFKKVSQGTLTFQFDSEQTIKNLHFSGTDSDLIKLRSTTDESQWYFDLTDSWQVDYVDVKDGHKIGTPIVAPSNSLDSGNNTNWFSLTSVKDANTEDISVVLYPNPAQDYLYLTSGEQKLSGIISVYNKLGQKVKELMVVKMEDVLIDIRNLPNGPYLCVIDDNGDGGLQTVKFIVFK